MRHREGAALLHATTDAARRFGPALASALIAVAGLGFAGRSLILALTLSTPVPYEDQWEVVGDLMRFRAGDYGLGDLFAFHNEHRIVLARLSFFADDLCCRLGNVSVVLTTYAVLAGLAALLASTAARGRGWRVKLVAFALALPSLWSLAGWINLGWAFQLPWAYVHVLPALAIVLFATATRRRGRDAWVLLAGACLADGLGALSLAGGLVTLAPVIAVAIWTRARPALLGVFAAAHVLIVLLYLQGYQPSDVPPVLDPWRVTAYLVPYLGTAYPGAPRTSILVGGVGLVMALAGFAWATARALRGRPLDPPLAALLGVAGFVVAEGVATGVGRAGLPDPTTLALRYGTPSEVFWTALGLAAWRWSWRAGTTLGGARTVAARWAGRGLAAAALAGIAAGNLAGSTAATWTRWSAAVDNEGFNLINGVTTGPSALQTFPWPDGLRDRVAFLRDAGLGPFAAGQSRFRFPAERIRGLEPGDLDLCGGALDRFDAENGQIHVQGWAVPPGPRRPAAWVAAVGVGHRLLGASRPWDPRWDEHRVSGLPVVPGYDFWFALPETEDPASVVLVALFTGSGVSPCRVAR